jgi:hypothetical protein
MCLTPVERADKNEAADTALPLITTQDFSGFRETEIIEIVVL